jgi:hypothetical protein
MGIMISFGAAVSMFAVAVPAIVYYEELPSGDPLADKLRGYGFFPINPPSTLIDVGSLYYVSADASDFRAICGAEQADVKDVVNRSGSWRIQEDLSQHGSFATNVSIDLRSLINGEANNNYVQKVHFSLTDILLEEIPLGSNLVIYSKLMNKPECSAAALQELNSGGFVCQGQKILRATAEFKLDRDSQSKLATRVDATPGKVNDALKAAVETQSDQSLVEREGRLFSGSALTYGVAMTPLCLAPKDARFPRVLPRSKWDRVVNFVLFRIVEPLWPAKRAELDVTQKTGT